MIRKIRLWPGLTIAFVAALPATGIAADGPPHDQPLRDLPLGRFVEATSLEQLADLVVTDTKVAQSASSATQKIVVLRAEDMDRLPDVNRNLAELMRYTSGQFVNVLSRNDANWGSYAGLGAKYNTYLLDGLPIDSFVDPMSLDSSAIERIEVYKGPASVLYSNYLTEDFVGNEAPLAGTTNFILKNRIETPLTKLSAGIGAWGTYNGRAYTQGRQGNLSYILGASSERSDYTQYGRPNSWLQTTQSPDYDKTRLFGNLSYALERPDHTVSLFLHHADHDGTMGRPNRDFRHRYDTLNLAYNNAFADDWHLQLKAGERRYDRDFANDDFTNTGSLALINREITRQTIRPLDLTLSHRHGRDNLLTVGADHQDGHYTVDSLSPAGALTRANDVRTQSTGYFVQEKIQWQDWVLRAGLRHNVIHHDYARLGGTVPAVASAFWSKNLWSLGARYNLAPTLAVYANAGSSFMVPSAKQIGGTVRNPATDSGELANPGLKPESGIGRDLGVDWQPTAFLNLGLRGFYNTIGSAIVTNVVSAAPSQTRSENAGSARSAGIEADLHHTLSAELVWFANVTRTRTRVSTESDPDQNGTAIPFAPETVINAGLTAALPGRVTLSPYFQWVGRYYDSASRSSRLPFGNYGIVSMRLRHQWRPGLDLVVDLNNLGNRRYDMPFDFRNPGFNGFAGLTIAF